MVSGWTTKTTTMSLHKWRAAVLAAAFVVAGCAAVEAAAGGPRRILVDTDTDTDDLLALLYILKQNRSEFDLKVTLNIVRSY